MREAGRSRLNISIWLALAYLKLQVYEIGNGVQVQLTACPENAAFWGRLTKFVESTRGPKPSDRSH